MSQNPISLHARLTLVEFLLQDYCANQFAQLSDQDLAAYRKGFLDRLLFGLSVSENIDPESPVATAMLDACIARAETFFATISADVIRIRGLLALQTEHTQKDDENS